MTRSGHFALYTILALFIGSTLFAGELALSNYFSNNMVVQREKPVKVWGTATVGAKVTVEFAGQKKTATAGDDGNWVATLDAMPANAKPQTLKVSSSINNQKSTIKNCSYRKADRKIQAGKPGCRGQVQRLRP